jgi:hypothetical protein
LRFDLNHSDFSQRVVTKAAPLPFCRFFDQSAFDRIAMQVEQLLHELALTPHVAIIIALLPERTRIYRTGSTAQLFGEQQLQVVNCIG